MKIHLWNCYNPSKISVNINKTTKDNIRDIVKTNPYQFADKLKIHPARVYDYFIYQSSPIPLDILLKLSKIIGFSSFEIEKNIILYKQMYVPNKNSVKNPKLPIELSPYLTSLVANLFFDGSVPEDGKGTYYNQKNEEIMNDFIKKIKEIFGEVSYSSRLDHRGVFKCRLPRLIGEICRHIYDVNSFGTFDSRIPKIIFNLNKNHKIAFILSGIIDEGSITYDGSVQFSISNMFMLEDFKKLCDELGLKTTSIKKRKNDNHYYIYIRSINLLNDFAEKFNKEYPLISMRYKQERLKKSLIIKKQKFLYTKDFADARRLVILSELKKKENTINFLSNKFLINPKTINRYFHELMRANVIGRKKKSSEYYYFLLTH